MTPEEYTTWLELEVKAAKGIGAVLLADNARLRELLQNQEVYAGHTNDCTVFDGSFVCDCGFDPVAEAVAAELSTEAGGQQPEHTPSSLTERLRLACVGSCSCMVKTPDIRYHSPSCTYRLVTEARFALEASPRTAVGSWQTMDSAPLDGRDVLLATLEGPVVGHYMPGGHCVEDHPPIDAGWYFQVSRGFYGKAKPTHWAALPAPPPAL